MTTDDDMVGFDGLQNLQLLSFADSQLTGLIPVWLSKLKSLEVLFLGGNQITRPVPSWLGALPRLLYIRLAHNRLLGEFPKQLCKLPRLVYERNIAPQVDSYEFELPLFGTVITDPSFLPCKLSFFGASINLSNNNLEGDIPNEIGQLQLLRELRLDSNNFSGIIPNQISNLKNLENLNFSLNHLSGKIPSSLVSLHFLKQFNVSYNLQGPIPISHSNPKLQCFCI